VNILLGEVKSHFAISLTFKEKVNAIQLLITVFIATTPCSAPHTKPYVLMLEWLS
jgi:hypothetical protein